MHNKGYGLCLNMIVRNEVKNIERLLRSVASSIDYYVICDTGSEDNTVEFIQELTQEIGLQGEIFHHEWKNFGHNRTLALKAAHEALEAKRHDCNWVLVIDADEKFEVADPNWLAELNPQQSYYIYKKDAGVEYKVQQIINIKHQRWEWRGPAHNYPVRLDDYDQSDLVKGAWIIRDISFQGGKSKRFKTPAEKYLYDAELFEQELAANPNDSRSQFYLAQSYKDGGQLHCALKAYLKRAEMANTWVQERYISYCEAGKIYLQLGQPEKSLQVYLKAYKLLPHRAEAPTEYGNVARNHGQKHSAYALTKEALANHKKIDDDLFLNSSYGQWRLLDAHSINAFSVNKLKEAYEACRKITVALDSQDISMPAQSEARIRANWDYYQKAMDSKMEKKAEYSVNSGEKSVPFSQKEQYAQQCQSKGYQFTEDWFSHNIPVWQQVLQQFANSPNLKFLEIGSWEGRSTCWLLDNILTHKSAHITCIDTFKGNIEHERFDGNFLKSVGSRFDFNITKTVSGEKVKKIVGKSQEFLRTLSFNTYDFLYIDGSHIARDVLEDAVLGWNLVKANGIIIFDDYEWARFKDNPTQHPKLAVDSFLSVFRDEIKIIHKGYQVIIQKKSTEKFERSRPETIEQNKPVLIEK